MLRRAVEAAGLGLRFELTFWGQEEGLRADFRPAGFAPWLTEDSFWVRCGAVPSAGAAKAREMLERDAIPRLIEWARGIEALDPASPPRHERQRFFYKLEP